MTQPGIEPRSPGPLANTLTSRPMSGVYYHSSVEFIAYYHSSVEFITYYHSSVEFIAYYHKLATIVEGDPKAPFSIAYYTKV